MSKFYAIPEGRLIGIASAIRGKLGSSDGLKIDEFENAITDIPAGGSSCIGRCRFLATSLTTKVPWITLDEEYDLSNLSSSLFYYVEAEDKSVLTDDDLYCGFGLLTKGDKIPTSSSSKTNKWGIHFSRRGLPRYGSGALAAFKLTKNAANLKQIKIAPQGSSSYSYLYADYQYYIATFYKIDI